MKKTISFIVIFVAAFVGGRAYAAIAELYGLNRLATLHITCPSAGSNTCVVEIQRVRSLLPAHLAEAVSLGVEVDTIADALVKRTATRAQINTFIGTTSP